MNVSVDVDCCVDKKFVVVVLISNGVSADDGTISAGRALHQCRLEGRRCRLDQQWNPRCLSFGALASELAEDASNLADDDTMLAEGPAEWCQSEVDDVDISVVGMIDGVPTTTRQRLCPCPAHSLPTPSIKKNLKARYKCANNIHSLLEKSGLHNRIRAGLRGKTLGRESQTKIQPRSHL